MVLVMLARWMRLLGPCVALVLLVGCASQHSDGGLWDRQAIQQEDVQGRLPAPQRQAARRGVELAAADAALETEQERLGQELADCPSAAREPLKPSAFIEVRDSVRIRAAGDTARLQRVGSQALADWYVRRARATGSMQQCDSARAALNGQTQAQQPVTDVVGQLGWATVTRAASYPGDALAAPTNEQATALYGLAWTDTLRAQSPLPEQLSAAYGGALLTEQPLPPAIGGRSSEEVVDVLAPAYPTVEPDALLLALTAR
jgi:hypothetical protein